MARWTMVRGQASCVRGRPRQHGRSSVACLPIFVPLGKPNQLSEASSGELFTGLPRLDVVLASLQYSFQVPQSISFIREIWQDQNLSMNSNFKR